MLKRGLGLEIQIVFIESLLPFPLLVFRSAIKCYRPCQADMVDLSRGLHIAHRGIAHLPWTNPTGSVVAFC